MAKDEKKECKVPDCGARAVGQGFCRYHYDRWRQGSLEGDWPPYKRVRTLGRTRKAASEPPPEKLPKSANIVTLAEGNGALRVGVRGFNNDRVILHIAGESFEGTVHLAAGDNLIAGRDGLVVQKAA